MEITLTWGDVVAHTLIALGVAVVVYLFSLLYRYAAPRVIDYLAQRSVSTSQAKIARLERRLAHERALGLMKAELERDMKLMGCIAIGQLSRDNLRLR